MKFRAYDKKSKSIIHAVLGNDGECPFTIIHEPGPHVASFFPLLTNHWDRCIEHQDSEGNDLYIGDICKIKVERLSSNHSTWYQMTNVNHGMYDLLVRIVEGKGVFHLVYNPDDVYLLEKPMGKECNDQVVATIRISADDLIGGVLVGNEYLNPELWGLPREWN